MDPAPVPPPFEPMHDLLAGLVLALLLVAFLALACVPDGTLNRLTAPILVGLHRG